MKFAANRLSYFSVLIQTIVGETSKETISDRELTRVCWYVQHFFDLSIHFVFRLPLNGRNMKIVLMAENFMLILIPKKDHGSRQEN